MKSCLYSCLILSKVSWLQSSYAFTKARYLCSLESSRDIGFFLAVSRITSVRNFGFLAFSMELIMFIGNGMSSFMYP